VENCVSISKGMKLGPYLTVYTKIKLKGIKHLNARTESIKLLEENIEENILGNEFFGYHTKKFGLKSKNK
jgi:hypothetical protein